jgi:3-oxoadipate enol-lactonase
MPQADINGIPVDYRIRGDGPPLVLIHGLACGQRMWTRQTNALAKRFTVITYDQRGHGASGAPDDPGAYSPGHLAADLIGLLDRLGIDRTCVAGFSLGGGPALALAMRQPRRVEGLVLADVGAGAEDGWRSSWLAARWAEMARVSPPALYEEMLRHEYFKTYAESRPRCRRHMHALLAATPIAGLRHTLTQVIGKRVSLFRQTWSLGKIRVPTLILRGGRDYACLHSARLLAETIPGAVRAEIAGAGHMTPLEQPLMFNAAVTDFFGKLAGR